MAFHAEKEVTPLIPLPPPEPMNDLGVPAVAIRDQEALSRGLIDNLIGHAFRWRRLEGRGRSIQKW